MAFSVDTMVVTLALSKAFTKEQIDAIGTGGVTSITYNELTNSLDFSMSNGNTISVAMPPQMTQDEKIMLDKLGVDVNGKLTYDGSIVDSGMVKVDVDDNMSYLGLKIDTTTMGLSDAKKLEAISLKGLLSSIAEINFLQGLDENIMSKFAQFGNGAIKAYSTTFPTYADLLLFDFNTLDISYSYLMYVATDESHDGNGTVYLANHETNNSTNLPSFAGLSTATQRNLSVDKVDLTNANEVKGILPQANMDLTGLVKEVDLSGYMLKSVYDQNGNGIVDKAETLEGLTATIPQINAGVPLANLIKTDGTGTKFFSDDGTYRTPSGGGGGSSVSPSEINGNIINNGAQMVVYDDSEVQADIASLNARSVINQEMRFCSLRNSAVQPLTTGSILKFNSVIEENGNMEYNLTKNSIKLTKGSIWDIRVSVLSGTSGYTYLQLVDANTREALSETFSTISPNYNDTENARYYISKLFKCNKDIEICVKVVTGSTQNLSYSENSYSTFSVIETAKSYSLDPVEYAQNHDVKYGSFTTTNVGALSANSPLVINTIISGNIELNSSKTGIKLEANKKYKISLNGSPLLSSAVYGGVFVYDLTHNRVTTNMICNSTTINVNGSYFNTGSGTFLETTEDLEISVCFNSSVLEVIDNNQGTFNILVEEIKNPVVVEYTNLKEISNPLMSSEISQEAPIGTVIEYVGDSLPDHYLACNGQVYSIVDYQELFNKIGNKFGGDGITTFAVPNYSGDKFYIKSEATHYAINQYGGFQMDTLWEGKLITNNTSAELEYPYEDYDSLNVTAMYDNVYVTFPIDVKQIKDNITYLGVQVLSIGSVDTTGRLLFTGNRTLKLTNSTGKVSITRVVGVKGSIPTVLEGGAL